MSNQEPVKPSKCFTCGGTKFWLRKGWGKPEYICQTCQPNPNEEVKYEPGK